MSLEKDHDAIMRFEFKYELSAEEREALCSFYNKLCTVSIEQHPLWVRAGINSNIKYCYFFAIMNEQIVCSAVIREEKRSLFKFTVIEFGPLFNDEDILIGSLAEIYAHYERMGMMFCEVQLGFATGAQADYVEYNLNKLVNVQYVFDRYNWSSIRLSLTKDEDDIFRQFSKGHKSDIKRAIKTGLEIISEFSDDEFDEFLGVFIRMYRERKLAIESDESELYFRHIRDFLRENNNGKILLVRDNEKRIIGGIIILYQGDTVRYFKGAADPACRKLPILHLAIWEGIRHAKSANFNYFDFWGYNHFVKEDDQIYKINRFKKGFGGEFVFYPKRMYWIYKPLEHRIYKLLVRLYQITGRG